jgi:hypothetical protein
LNEEFIRKTAELHEQHQQHMTLEREKVFSKISDLENTLHKEIENMKKKHRKNFSNPEVQQRVEELVQKNDNIILKLKEDLDLLLKEKQQKLDEEVILLNQEFNEAIKNERLKVEENKKELFESYRFHQKNNDHI